MLLIRGRAPDPLNVPSCWKHGPKKSKTRDLRISDERNERMITAGEIWNTVKAKNTACDFDRSHITGNNVRSFSSILKVRTVKSVATDRNFEAVKRKWNRARERITHFIARDWGKTVVSHIMLVWCNEKWNSGRDAGFLWMEKQRRDRYKG
jgi:hypothetical protein